MGNTEQTPSASRGITGFGAYIPRLRLPRSVIADAHRWMSPNARARGSRAFCSWDEDALTMAVEAARSVLSHHSREPESISVVSTTMPNADLQHSALIATVLDLPLTLRSSDLGYSQRAATSALISALDAPSGETLLIASEKPLAKPASPQEMLYGAGAAAFTMGDHDVLAYLVAAESVASPLVDHFRTKGSNFDYAWEDRWVRDEGYGKVVIETISRLLQKSGVVIGDIDHFVMGAPARGAASMVARKIGFDGVVADSLGEQCGYTGVADPMLGLVSTLEQAAPGERILLIGFGQGCDALILETTPELEKYTPQRGVEAALSDGYDTDSYLQMLSFQGLYQPDWGMRGEKEVRTALTDLYRSVDQIWKFQAGRCDQCGTLQFPQLAYCVSCNAPAGQFTSVPLTERTGRVLTHTADWLTYYPSPPLFAGFVQFDDEARLLMEIVDVGSEGLAEGTMVKMVFRIKDRDTMRGWTRYFWKATPCRESGETQ